MKQFGRISIVALFALAALVPTNNIASAVPLDSLITENMSSATIGENVAYGPEVSDELKATRATISVSCTAFGSYSWSVTLIDGIPFTSYPVNQIGFSYQTPGGGGGDFNNIFKGDLTTNGNGLGTSQTYSGWAPAGATQVTIDAKVGAFTVTGSDLC